MTWNSVTSTPYRQPRAANPVPSTPYPAPDRKPPTVIFSFLPTVGFFVEFNWKRVYTEKGDWGLALLRLAAPSARRRRREPLPDFSDMDIHIFVEFP